MNAFDQARREILGALFMEYHRTSGAIVDYHDLKSRYSLKVSKSEWFDPIVSEIEHLLIVSRTFDGVSARIHPRGYGEILRELLQQLNGTSIEVSWSKEEVLSDATDHHWFPLPSGWKWYQFNQAGEESQNAAPAADRIVRFDHNQPEYLEIKQGLDEVYDIFRSANDLPIDGDERGRLVSGLAAARSLWEAAQLKIIQVKIGVILAVEDALRVLVAAGKAVAAALIVDAIKSLVKSHTGIDLDRL